MKIVETENWTLKCSLKSSLLYPYKIVSIEIIRKKSPIEELLLWAVQKTVKIDC